MQDKLKKKRVENCFKEPNTIDDKNLNYVCNSNNKACCWFMNHKIFFVALELPTTIHLVQAKKKINEYPDTVYK